MSTKKLSRTVIEWRERFYVDNEGILRHVPAKARRSGPRFAWRIDPAAVVFVKGRRVRETGDIRFWMVAANACALCGPGCSHLRFRQDRRLDDAEIDLWRGFNDRTREPHVWTAPAE